ncbi:MAG: enoyl-CoA hydratase [Halieaceae bacterium]|jgi:enoyl-CoA hydratase
MPVLTTREDRVLLVGIDRPECRNAVNAPTAARLAEVFREFDQDDSLDTAILYGTGSDFCAGADLKAAASGDGSNRTRAGGAGPMGPTRLSLSKPVIAAVSGHAVAGGLELALWCDLRVADATAVFGVYCRRWGVPLVDGGTVRLPRIVGQGRALDMILTGRAVHADEALQMGLVNRLCESGQTLQTARELAAQLSAFPQGCLRADRASVYAQWSLDEEQALLREFRGGDEVIESGETRRGAERFARGRGRHGDFSDI